MRELSKRQLNVIRYLETRLSRNGIRRLYAIFLSGLERPEDITKGLHEYDNCGRQAKAQAAAVPDDELDDVLVKLAINWNRF